MQSPQQPPPKPELAPESASASAPEAASPAAAAQTYVMEDYPLAGDEHQGARQRAKRKEQAEAPQNGCATCKKPEAICVCALLASMPSKHRILVLQHPQEDDHLLGTAALLRQGLANTQVRVGLSWASLAHALGRDEVARHRWALVFPASAPAAKNLSSGKNGARASHRPAPASTAAGTAPGAPPVPATIWLDRTGERRQKTPRLDGIILLDGTWTQVKTLLWRNPWLSKLTRLSLQAPSPSIYGRLRREPSRGHRSTLEACVAALAVLGEPDASLQPMLRALRTMAQRLRDAGTRPATIRARHGAGRPGRPNRRTQV